MANQCTSCGTDLTEDAKFCASCGTPVAVATDAVDVAVVETEAVEVAGSDGGVGEIAAEEMPAAVIPSEWQAPPDLSGPTPSHLETVRPGDAQTPGAEVPGVPVAPAWEPPSEPAPDAPQVAAWEAPIVADAGPATPPPAPAYEPPAYEPPSAPEAPSHTPPPAPTYEAPAPPSFDAPPTTPGWDAPAAGGGWGQQPAAPSWSAPAAPAQTWNQPAYGPPTEAQPAYGAAPGAAPLPPQPSTSAPPKSGSGGAPFGGILIFLGGVMMLIGSFLPWAEARINDTIVELTGFENATGDLWGGPATIAFGALLVIFSLFYFIGASKKRVPLGAKLLTLLLALGAFGFTVYLLIGLLVQDIDPKPNALIGLWLCFGGSIVALFGSLFGRTRKA